MRGRIWRGGMIGAGVWSEIQLTAWAGVENAEIVALCDRHPERLEPRARRFGIARTFAEFGAMLAADRGLPVLCQKPFCTSMEEARDVVEYCRQAGVRLMINDNYRWRAPRFEIDGTKGTLALTADASMHLVTDTDRKCWQFHQDVQPESCANTQRHFIDCLERGAEFETSGSETLKTMALVYACYLSAEEKRAVSTVEFLTQDAEHTRRTSSGTRLSCCP